MIVINDLNFIVRSKTILESINLIIDKGEFAVIIGPNGAGKSTLLKSMLNLIPLQSGKITIDGVSHYDYLKNNQIGYLPQNEDINPDFPMKVSDLVLMGRFFHKKLFKSFTNNDHDIVINALKMVNGEHLAQHMISSLSGGEFQRVLLARALATESKYIFLDEPEAGIDKKGIKSFYELLEDLHQSGKTIIAVSHDLDRLKKHCTKVICLDRRLHDHNSFQGISPVIIHDHSEDLC